MFGFHVIGGTLPFRRIPGVDPSEKQEEIEAWWNLRRNIETLERQLKNGDISKRKAKKEAETLIMNYLYRVRVDGVQTYQREMTVDDVLAKMHAYHLLLD